MEESRLAFEHRRLVDDAVLERFLAHAHRLLRSDGQLLLDSVDVRVTSDPLHLAYQEANRVAGRYIGEIRLQFEFRGEPDEGTREADGPGTDARPRIVPTPSHPAKPMAPEDAALELDTTGRELLVFRDAGSGRIHVLYRRDDGDFGLIDAGR